jgi:hypothetical protein
VLFCEAVGITHGLFHLRDLLSPFGDSDKLLRASTGKGMQMIMPLELGRGKLFFTKPNDKGAIR